MRIASRLYLAVIVTALCAACSKPTAEVPDFDSTNPVYGFQRGSIAEHPEVYRPFIEHFHSSEEMPALLARLPYDRISLRRGGCYGRCPIYEVVFHRDGRAEYHAKKFVPEVGEFTGRINPGIYARLCYLVESSHFQDFKEHYDATWTDDATTTVTVTQSDGTKKEVSDYGEVGPIQLWTIQELMDRIREHTEWKPVK